MFIPLQYIATLVLADVIARWQMEWPHIICCLLWGRCYCPVAGGIATHLFLCVVMADVIAQWQMEWPLQGVSVFPPGGCYSKGVRWIFG